MTADATPTFDPNRSAQVIAQILAAMGDFPMQSQGDAFSGGLPSSAPGAGTATLPSNFGEFLGGAGQQQQGGATGATGSESAPLENVSSVPISSGFETAQRPQHQGIDLGVPAGTTALAAISGTVTHQANDDPQGYGEWVEITGANGETVRYGHLSAATVDVGSHVVAGQVIGSTGGIKGAWGSGDATGPHLHFEVRINGKPVDPSHFLALTGAPIAGDAQGQPHPAEVIAKAMSPEQVAGAEVANVVQAAAGQTPTHTLQPDTSSTTGGQSSVSGATTGADNDPRAIDAFLAATRQHESGGDYTIYNKSGQSDASGAYQFLSSTWKSQGGSTAAAAQASPAEQDAIARKMALSLFDRYHSWRLVAIAWYGGPGIADQVAAGKNPGSPSGQGSYLAYGEDIANAMTGG